MKIKICGITNLEDALFATRLGAWAVGFNFYEKSPRYLSPQEAKKIIKKLPRTILTIGIFVNATQKTIVKIQQETGIQRIQLHGDESIDFCEQFSQPIIKAIRLPQSIDYFFPKNLSAVLIDHATANQYGGTGHCVDWSLAKQVAARYPTILAGGLTSQNVITAIQTVQPMAIDVCSGVEMSYGKKSKDKMQQLFSIIQEASL